MDEQFMDFWRKLYGEDDVFYNNEIQANRLVGFTMLLTSIAIILVWLLNKVGIFQTSMDMVNSLTIQAVPEILIPCIICYITKGDKKWLKYLMLIALTIVLSRIDCVLNFNVVIIMVLPVILSSRYFSRRFTIFVAVLTVLLFALSAFAGAYYNLGLLDLNFYDVPVGTVLEVETTVKNAVKALGLDNAARTKSVMLLSFLPKLICYTVI